MYFKASNCLLSVDRNTDTYCTDTYLITKLLDALYEVFCNLKTSFNFQAFKAFTGLLFVGKSEIKFLAEMCYTKCFIAKHIMQLFFFSFLVSSGYS